MLETRYVEDDSIVNRPIAQSPRPRDALDIFRFASGSDKSALKLPVFFGSRRLSNGSNEPALIFGCNATGKPTERSFQGFRIYSEDVSRTLIQPFAGYTWPDTTGLTLNMEDTYDWEAGQWTAPINLALSHIFKLGSQRVSLQFGGRYYPVHPDETASWGLRFTATFVFPE